MDASDDLSEIEQLLAECLEHEGADRVSWLAALRERSQDRADAVQARLDALGSVGLASVRSPANRTTIGRYRLCERVGAGGMGEVWRAETEVGEVVALKLVRPELLWFEGARLRFEREARAIAALDHEGIVRLLEVGDEDGLPWMALEWVEGTSLEELLACFRDRLPASLRAADLRHALAALALPGPGQSPDPPAFAGDAYPTAIAEVVARVADALDHAHSRGVVHRDVKPSNVLVGTDGRVLLADFGLAFSEEGSRLTRTGSWLGSLPYAAPEQVGGERGADARADVYSLGVTLFEGLALHPPFSGGNEGELRARIARGDHPPLRRSNASVSAALELVCHRAMDVDPARRFATAAELAADLRRAVRGTPVLSRPLPAWLRIARWSRQHARITAAAAVALFVLATVTAWAVRERRVSDRVRRMADSELVARLVRDSEALWPPAAERLAAVDDWLQRADELLDRRAAHLGSLEELRSSSLPYGDRLRESDRAPTRALLLTMRLEVEGLGHLLAERAGAGPPAPERVERDVDAWSAAFDLDTPGFLDGFRRRIDALRELVERSDALGDLEAEQLDGFARRLEDAARALAEERSHRFEREFDQWRHDELVALVGGLDAIDRRRANVRDLRRRTLAIADAASSARDSWREALAAIRRSEVYAGIPVEPVELLQPLRADPRTGLWEFLLLGSGEAPRADPTPGDPDRLRVEPETGVVLVLLPGGAFEMGSDSVGSPASQPRHPVVLDPFFISKYELTIAQAERLAPSSAPPSPDEAGNRPARMQWQTGRDVLHAHGLDHPTEAQWEYAACAGNAESERAPAVVPADRLSAVGTRPPNAFGLHDCDGNVQEWCRDWFILRGYRSLPSRPGDGLKATVLTGPGRSIRGGNFTDDRPRSLRERRLGNQAAAATTGLRPVMSLR